MRNHTFLRESLVLIGASLTVGACIAPPPSGESGSLAEIGEMIAAGGAELVKGSVDPGLTADPESMGDDGIPTPESGEFEQTPESEWEEEYDDDPYVRFGERIIVREVEGTTFITKPYNLPTGRPAKVIQLIDALQPFDARPRPEVGADGELPPLDPGVLEHQVLAGFDDEFFTNFRQYDSKQPMATPAAATAIPLSDLLVVTATPRMLSDFEDFLDLFAGGGVPQIEIEAKIIEIRETSLRDVGVRADLMFGTTNFIRSAGYLLPNVAGSTEAILTLGAVQDGTSFEAILQAIEGWQNVTIDSRPKTVVRAGGVAHIEAYTEIPFLQFKTLDPSGFFTAGTDYKKIGVELWISPRMVGSNTLALDVRIEGSQQTGSQATFTATTPAIMDGAGNIITAGSSTPIEVPIIAYRTAKTVVHLKPGQTLVIGGLTQEREQEIVNKIPFLGDLPLIGWLFRSKFTTTERQHVIFAVSPRIIQHSDFESDL